MFEQFLVKILIKKLNLNKGLDFKGVKNIYSKYGFEFESEKNWNKIYEMRLLVNTVKHANGNSKKQLQEKRKDFFYIENNEMIKNTIIDINLNVNLKEIIVYSEKVIEFINNMPNKFELKNEK